MVNNKKIMIQDLEKIHKMRNKLISARKNDVSGANKYLPQNKNQFCGLIFSYPSVYMASSVITSSQICESTAASAL